MNAAHSTIFTAGYEHPAVTALFSDDSWVRALVRVEVALARAQVSVGVIPASAAEAIVRRAQSFKPDIGKLAAGAARDAFPVIELVAQLRAHVGKDAGNFVHWGATTQDILDTALVLQLDMALTLIEAQIAGTSAALATLADRHRHTVMTGRTHLQPALPVTFGLQAAGWLAPFNRHRRRLAELRARLRVVQCGGAAGTLASLRDKGPAVAGAFASELGLGVPAMPWHAQRDNLLEAAGWLWLVACSAAKIARDVLLLSQAEVGELREPAGGGSSAMPQKSNPVLSETILVAAHSAGAHHAALASAPPPEHQRGAVTGQLEFLHLPRQCALTAGTLRAAEQLAGGLVVDGAGMKRNLDATQGVILAEAATLALCEHLPGDEARRLVREACALALDRGPHLIDLLRTRTGAPVAWDRLRDESNYLGSAGAFIDAVLAETATLKPV